MIDQQNMSAFAIALAADVVRQAGNVIHGSTEPSEEESLAVLQLTLMTAAVLEAHAIHALPPEYARNVRAFVERLSDTVQRLRNKALDTTETGGKIVVSDSSSVPSTQAPAQPEKV